MSFDSDETGLMIRKLLQAASLWKPSPEARPVERDKPSQMFHTVPYSDPGKWSKVRDRTDSRRTHQNHQNTQ